MSNYIYDLPTSGEFYEILNNTIAPNLTFTQCNLFECLEQIFMYLDGYPTLTKENVLDIRYFNDNNGTVIETKESDAKIAMSESRYVNGFITDFQNADINNVLTYPSKKTYSNVQSKEIGIVDSEDNYIMRVDQPIYNLKSVKTKVQQIILKVQSYKGSLTSFDNFYITFNSYVDLVENIQPQDIYLNLDNIEPITSVYVDDIPLKKQNCLVYSQKSKEIDVGTTYKQVITTSVLMPNVVKSSIRKLFGIYHSAGNNTENLIGITPQFYDVKSEFKYRIEYETLANGRLLIEGSENKFEGAERLDIGQGASDLMKTGLNLLGMSIKTGVDTLVRTEKFTKEENRIKIGSLYYENGERYIATKVDECVFGDFVFSTIQYSKNFNKLSQFIALDQKKRFNEIDSSLTLRSEDVYKEYLYFSLNQVNSNLMSDIHLSRPFSISQGLLETFKLNPTNTYKIDFATINTSNYDGSSNEKFGNVWLPLIQYGSGNALCFEMAMNSPINANSNFQYQSDISKWFSKYILYTANDGFADLINISFYNQIKEVETSDLPQVNSEMLSSTNARKLGKFENLNYFKKQNEIFAMNYELLCLPYQNQDIFIGERFIKYNGIIGNSIPKMKFKLFISDSELYSLMDKYGLGSEVSGKIEIVVQTLSAGDYKGIWQINILRNGSFYQLDKPIKSWAICDEFNNIYLCANQDLTINDQIKCYIFTSHSRL